MTTPRSTHEADLRTELARLEREIENLRTLFAHAAEDSRRDDRRPRRIARTSRVESTNAGSRTLRVVSPPLGTAARVAAALIPDGLGDDLDGPEAA